MSLLGDKRQLSTSGGEYPSDLATTAAVTMVRPFTSSGSSWENPKSPSFATRCLSNRKLALYSVHDVWSTYLYQAKLM